MKNILVCSHQRSGTHFLINSIAINLDWTCDWLDVPPTTDTARLKKFFEDVKPQNKVFKSHHQFDCFSECWDIIKDKFDVFYIYRDGRDVLTSMFFYYVLKQRWVRARNVGEYMRLNPQVYNYDYRYSIIKSDNHVDRWVNHVEDWLNRDVCYITYEKLSRAFPGTISDISSYLKRPMKTEKPGLNHRAVHARKGIIGDYKKHFNQRDLDYFFEKAEPTMKKLRYEDNRI